MSKKKWDFRGQRWSAAAIMLLILGSQVPRPETAAAKPASDQTIKDCANEEVMLPSHPDIQALKQLFVRYGTGTSMQTDLGMTRIDFAQSLQQLLSRVEATQESKNQIRSEDLALLTRLKQDYATELASLRQPRPDGVDITSFSSSNRQLSRLAGSIAPPPPAAVAPVPFGRAESAPVTEQKGTPRSKIALPIPPGPIPAPGGDINRDNPPGTFNTEEYDRINENPFQRPTQAPLSTFSIDVDTAAYSNVRRFVSQGQLPPKDAVRLEEMINYFSYDYPQPKADQPFSVTTEVATTPWNSQNKLVQVGLKGKELTTTQPSNLVFLMDVSGSMRQPNKLPLVKKSLCQLVRQLGSQDRVSIVVYAGNAGVVLEPTPGSQKNTIMKAINRLEAGGSTAGGEGIVKAYDLAKKNLLKDGNNRVILATDGDFNVGVSSDAELERLIEKRRDEGIFLTVLGFGTGNYKDSKMELLADKGNGNYAYLDNILEAQKVLVHDLRSTLFTIAKDVKIQVEFNPNKVQAYRLIGYENRLLKAEDFNDDRKDAGEIGSGHTVTALYEVIPAGVTTDIKLPDVDPLKYQKPQGSSSDSDELMQVKLRYKDPTGSKSKLISQPIADAKGAIATASDNLKFASSVAMYGMMLRESELKGDTSYTSILNLAKQAKGEDTRGYRQAFIDMVESSQKLSQTAAQRD
ncbi:MAG: von Willebrand factor type A domain-containing protein [Thermosynechococcaceae cyanobacterium]